jgi:hypothetical protein
MPVTARCPRARGGCGKLRKVPRQHAVSTLVTAAGAPAGWDPPSEPRAAYRTAGQCPKCGTPGLIASPRGTVRGCLTCKGRVIPAGVAAPYERGTGSTREARSQRERDLEALELARRKGIMRGQLDAIADDGRLTPESLAAVEWFAEQVKAATTGQRLDELADLYAVQKIRRRGWLQGRPPAITAGYAEDDDDGQGDDDQDDDDWPDPDAARTAVALATPATIAGQQHRAQPQPTSWVEAIAALGWRLAFVQSWDGCQIIADGIRCTSQEAGHHVGSSSPTAGGWACEQHFQQIVAVLYDTNRARGIRQ